MHELRVLNRGNRVYPAVGLPNVRHHSSVDDDEHAMTVRSFSFRKPRHPHLPIIGITRTGSQVLTSALLTQ